MFPLWTTGRLISQIRCPAGRRTPQTGIYFSQPPRRTAIARVLVPGSGVPKPKKRTFNKKTPAHSAPSIATAQSAPLPTTEPAGAAVVRPPAGASVFCATTETRIGARASADRRPSCVLCRRSFGERRARDSSHVPLRDRRFAASPRLKFAEFGGLSSPAVESTKPHRPISILCLPKWHSSNLAEPPSRPPCSGSERSEASVAARGGGYQVKRARASSVDQWSNSIQNVFFL